MLRKNSLKSNDLQLIKWRKGGGKEYELLTLFCIKIKKIREWHLFFSNLTPKDFWELRLVPLVIGSRPGQCISAGQELDHEGEEDSLLSQK